MICSKDFIENCLSCLWAVDILIGVFCIAASVDIAFVPGRVASFESGVLALVVIFFSFLVILAAVAPGFLIHKWIRALERFLGKGILYVLMGVLVSSPAVTWRLVCAAITIGIGFAYILISIVKRNTHPRPLLTMGSEESSGGSGGALAVRSPSGPPLPEIAHPVGAPVTPSQSQNPFLNPPPGHFYPEPLK